jgi:hypothetical protein
MQRLNKLAPFLLGAIALLCFGKALFPGMMHEWNDLPLGALSAEYFDPKTLLLGFWDDLNWLGIRIPEVPINLSTLLGLVLGPLWYAKLFPSICLFILGIGSWIYFKSLRFSPLLSLFMSIACMLNMTFFAFSAWGVGAWNIALGWFFIVLAILQKKEYTVSDLLLAGFFTGLVVVDGTDVGAILSCVIGIYFIFKNWPRNSKQFVKPAVQLSAIVIISFLVAFARIATIVETQITSVSKKNTAIHEVGTWEWATQWSLPKK